MKKRRCRVPFIILFLVSAVVFAAAGCSIKKLAMKSVADMMSGEMGAAAFSSDGDIELVGDALPFALKLYEIVLEENPEHPGMLETAGTAFIGYSQVWVQMPADMLPADQYTRAGWMYFFSREPVVYPEDLRGQKIAASDTVTVMAPLLEAMGFHTVSLKLNEIMSGLVSGMVDARYTVPMGAVMNIMLENGLKKKEVPAEAVSEWRELFEQGFRSLAGKVFPLETYENVEDYLTAYRSR